MRLRLKHFTLISLALYMVLDTFFLSRCFSCSAYASSEGQTVTPDSSKYKDDQLWGFTIGYATGWSRGWRVASDSVVRALASGRAKKDSYVPDELENWFKIDIRDALTSYAKSPELCKYNNAEQTAHGLAFIAGYKDAYAEGNFQGLKDYGDIAVPRLRYPDTISANEIHSEQYKVLALAAYKYSDKLGVSSNIASDYLDTIKNKFIDGGGQ